MAELGRSLTHLRINREPMPTPPRAVRNQAQIKTQFQCYLDQRVRRALRATFPELVNHDMLGNRAILSFGEGSRAQTPEQFTPDTAFFETRLAEPTRPNRAPGMIKTSWKWSYFHGFGHVQQTEFKKVLSQSNYYMEQHGSRYGFIITDIELVAIRRRDSNGNLELSDPIGWATGGNAAQPQLTVLLGLWYLGMLAADNASWRLP